MSSRPSVEAARRRTFAIISHPDAGKTTLTEKFLLYGGALQRGRRGQGARRAPPRPRRDWMELEQKRGISITSTVLQFPYRDHVLNLLDTPGHRDFSEDTYRVLAAADAAVMVLDAAKGIEPQTLKLFEVCRDRGLPLLTFINKYDRPGRDAARAARRDRAADRRCTPTPVTWPVGIAGDFRGVIDRRDGDVHPVHPHRPRRHRGARGDRRRRRAAAEEGDAWAAAQDELELLDAVGADLDIESFLAGDHHAGVLRLGAHQLRRAPAARRRSSTWPRRRAPRVDVDGKPRAARRAVLAGSCSRCRRTWTRRTATASRSSGVCSGRFERGMVVTHGRTGKPFATKYAHSVFGQERETVDEAYPGDVVGLVNATDVRVGDTLYVDDAGRRSRDPELRARALRVARVRDTGRFKQFRKGIAQLDEEGVVQVLRDADARRPGAGARRRRADAVRGGRAPAGERVRRARRAAPTGYTRRPPDRRRPRRRLCGRCAASRVLRAGRRRPAGAVREPLLAAAGRERATRTHPCQIGRRGLDHRAIRK